MKRKIASICFILLFLVGFLILTYPIIANQWNVYRQSQIITSYENSLSGMDATDFEAEWEKARAFNKTITANKIFNDVFGQNDEEEAEKSEYNQVLNVAGDGVMGYIYIPKINVKLSIYHGTKDSDLQTGAGHLNSTSLPIGGEGTHSVIAAHRGLPSAKLFSDVDQLVAGDRIYIHVLDETLAYEVDNVLPMVEADDAEALLEALSIKEGEDYISLFTCTPYGVNTHRLIVRAKRVPYNGEEDVEQSAVETMVKAVTDYYMLFLIMGLAVTTLVILLLKFLFRRKKSED